LAGLPINLAGPGDFGEVLDLCGKWLSAPREYFAARFANDPTLRKDRILFVRDGGRMVSTAHQHEVMLSFSGGKAVRCAGVGNVCTDEAFRGRGLAGSLVRELQAMSAKDGYAIDALFTDHQSFYEPAGYRKWKRPEVLFTRLRKPAEKAGIPVRAIEFPRDIPVILAIHDRWTSRLPLTAERSPAFWEHHFVWTPMHPGEDLSLALLAGGQAYIRAHTWSGAVKVIEFGALPGSEAEVLALANAVAETASLKCRGRARVPAVCGELIGALKTLARGEPVSDDELMLRITNPGRLAEESCGAWNPGGEFPPAGAHFWDTDGF